MTSYPTITDGDVIMGAPLTAAFQNLMTVNLGIGKGVISGLAISSGGTGIVQVTTGSFCGQAQDSVTTLFNVTIGSSTSGYFWIEARDNPASTPTTELTSTFADPGALWVCLGHVSSDGSGVVTVDMTNGRQIFGEGSFLANVAAALLISSPGVITAAGGFGRTTKTVAGSDVTLSATESAADEIFLGGTPGTARNLIVTGQRGWWVINRTDSAITVKEASGTGVVIATGKTARVSFDGTNVIRLTADA